MGEDSLRVDVEVSRALYSITKSSGRVLHSANWIQAIILGTRARVPSIHTKCCLSRAHSFRGPLKFLLDSFAASDSIPSGSLCFQDGRATT